MRIVRSEAELADALTSARREAEGAFGDPSVFIERFVEHGRHIEVQLLGDGFGNLVHLFERDCSVQRRHQKVIEEAPAPTITDSMRERLFSWALSIGRHVGYESAGTVEFLVRDEEAYFLEMNTRLQVEHPVTEMVTGLDIVALQLEIAQGQALPFDQSQLRSTGHAIEARAYAEDSAAGFLPQAGTPSFVRLSPRARVDGAVVAGEPVGTFYDPMLAKIIVYGPTRAAARRSLLAALDDSAIFGLATNLGFLRRVLASEQFVDATIDTGWLDAPPVTLPPTASETPFLVAALLVARSVATDRAGEPFGADGWRLGAPCAPQRVELEADGSRRFAYVDPVAGRVTVDGVEVDVAVVGGDEPGLVRVEVDGELVAVPFEMDARGVTVGYQAGAFSYVRPGPLDRLDVAERSDGTVVSPMPGVVSSVAVASGAKVERGDVLGTIESMKMELVLRAPIAGTVTEVAVASGDRVGRGDRLFVIVAGEV
jgi:3-methylcrotonyl-CoA carboxylase alpha subunit/acetyl-CoA/propionyl-CoA carboxylase biotin carboxyl carrier protein